MTEAPPWMMHTAIGAVTSIAGALVFVFKLYQGRIAKNEEKLERYEENHLKTSIDIAEMKRQIGYLEGQQEGIKNLAKQVLDVVADAAKPKSQ